MQHFLWLKKPLKIKQWPLLASCAEPFQGAEHKSSCITVGLRPELCRAELRADTAKALLMPRVPVTPVPQNWPVTWGNFSKPSWESDSEGCSSTGTRGTKLGHRCWEKPELIFSICYHKGASIPYVISHCWRSSPKVILTGREKAQRIGILPQMPKWNILSSSAALCPSSPRRDSLLGTGLGHRRNTHKPCKKERKKEREQILYQRAGHAHPVQAWETWVPFAACNATISLFEKITACWEW